MEGRRFYIFTVLQIVSVGILLWLVATWQIPWNAQRYIGTVLAVVGVSFIGLARYQLGKSFSIKAEAHALVTTGLYSRIRNPIYVFGLVMLIGLILAVQKPALWIVLVVVAIGQTVRARKEARVLEAAFREQYREYRRKTWF
jgi:protein-S-isoprenylcysteine O-methyltransferase Ste14